MRIDVHNHAIPQPAIELLNRDRVYGATVEDGVWRGGVHVHFELAPSFLDAGRQAGRAGVQGARRGGRLGLADDLLLPRRRRGGRGDGGAGNEGLAAMAAERRLKWMASVPLQAPERAAAVLEDAAAAGAVGVEIGTQRRGDAARRPVAGGVLGRGRAARTAGDAPSGLRAQAPAPAGLLPRERDRLPARDDDRARAADLRRVLDRHPELRVVRLHAGGYFPWQAGRLRHARTVRPELADSPTDPWSYLGQILLDPITHDPDALRYLVAKVGAENLVMGTDLPFDMATPEPLAALRAALRRGDGRADHRAQPGGAVPIHDGRDHEPCLTPPGRATTTSSAPGTSSPRRSRAPRCPRRSSSTTSRCATASSRRASSSPPTRRSRSRRRSPRPACSGSRPACRPSRRRTPRPSAGSPPPGSRAASSRSRAAWSTTSSARSTAA